jgi:hypothetical protein
MESTVVKSIIRWYNQEHCQEITLESHQLRVIEEKVKEGHEVKEVVKAWLIYNASDFYVIPTDFMADLEFESENVIVNWENPESEYKFGKWHFYGDY